jgi:hypothetical protein
MTVETHGFHPFARSTPIEIINLTIGMIGAKLKNLINTEGPLLIPKPSRALPWELPGLLNSGERES